MPLIIHSRGIKEEKAIRNHSQKEENIKYQRLLFTANLRDI